MTMARQTSANFTKARNDADELFDVQHLTSTDIADLEEALNTMDLEEMVTTVDHIVGQHVSLRRGRQDE
jgi:rRNA maturation endonuclease Nob1